MHTLNLTLNATTPEELECQLRALRVAITQRKYDLEERMQGRGDQAQAAYQWRIDFLDSLVDQMVAQEVEWLRKAREIMGELK